MIADIFAYRSTAIAVVSFFYSCLGFTFASSPGTLGSLAKPKKLTPLTLQGATSWNVHFKRITQKVEWQNLSIFPCDVKISCTFFLTNPPKSMKASFPSGVTFGVRPPPPASPLRRIPVWVERSGQKAAMERLQAETGTTTAETLKQRGRYCFTTCFAGEVWASYSQQV